LNEKNKIKKKKYLPINLATKYPIRNEILNMGAILGINIRLYEINERYWLLRKDLEKKYPGIRRQFNNLTKEWIPQLNRYFLDKNFGDYQKISRIEFNKLFSVGKNYPAKRNPQPLILLSPKGMLKLLARSSGEAMKVILIYLTELFEKLQLYDVTDFIAKYFKLMTPAERCFYATLYDIFPEIIPQYSISRMHVDFVIRNVVWEIDGEYHLNKKQWLIDAKRANIASKYGFITIRIPNNLVLEHPQWVREQVIEYMIHIINKIKENKEIE